MAEIDHRAKNLLAAIQAMVMLTKSNARSVGDYADTLIGRLHAMARAHDLLARDRWTGAGLHELIRNEFAAYVGADGHALRLAGEDVMLPPRAAQTLSLALHELTTNAAKYGALSVAGRPGRDRDLDRADGGGRRPRAELGRSRRAGGHAARASRLRQRADRARHRPRPRRQHQPHVRAPRACAARSACRCPEEPSAPPRAATTSWEGPVRGTVIIVQDDFVEAERLRLLLEQAGYRVPGIAGRTAEAMRLAQRPRPQLAIVDMMLEIDVDGIHTATELARRHALKVLITTGFPDAVIQAENVAQLACAIVKKPYTDQEMLAAVARCLA